MYKKIEFYKVVYNFLPISKLNNTDDELKINFIKQITNSIKPGDQYLNEKYQPNTSSILIEIIDIENDYIFGIIGKLEDLNGGILKRIRNKKDKTIVDSNEENINYYIENYTYFYVRLYDLICAVLTNSSAPRFKKHFCNYLKDITKSLLLEDLNIINVLDDNIDYKINKIKSLNEVKLVFDDSSAIGNELLNLTNTFYLSQSSLKEAKIDIALKVSPFTDKSKQILKNSKIIKSNFKKLELSGVDTEDKRIDIELIERLLTKKVSINIDEEYLKSTDDLDKIKEALVKALPSI